MSQGTFSVAFNQLSLLDPFDSLSPSKQKRIRNGWAGTFHDQILPLLIDAEPSFAVLYSASSSTRPSVPTYLILAYLILKDLFGWTDEQLLSQVLFNLEVQYALGTTAWAEQRINHNTLNRFRAANALFEAEHGYSLIHAFFDDFSRNLKDLYGFTSEGKKKRRMDSIMIDAGCKKMNRIELLHTCISNALLTLEEKEVSIPENLSHYLEDFDRNAVTYHDKGRASDKLNILGADAVMTLHLFSESMRDSEDFVNLKRVIGDQLILTEDGQFSSVKDGKELNSKVLQNPSDPEATFRTKAGENHVGYVGNFAETVDEETGLAIIDSADLQPNIHSDSKFCRAEIEKMAEEEDHTVLVADGAYGSDENFSKAKENGIELVTTALTGKDTPDLFADFEITEDQERIQIRCPNGLYPSRCSYDPKSDSWSVSYIAKRCKNCPLQSSCPLSRRKNVRSGKVSRKKINRARMQRELQSDRLKKLTRFRNGVEAVPSQLRRKQKIDSIPVMGRVRKKIWYLMDLMAINVRRIIRFEKQRSENGPKLCFSRFSVSALVNLLLQITNNLAFSEKSSYRCSFLMDIS